MSEAIIIVGPENRSIQGRVNYIGSTNGRPRYHVHDLSRDTLALDPRTVHIENARLRAESPSLHREGFALFPHRSAITEGGDPQLIARTHHSETEQLLLELTHADEVVCENPAVHRFTQRPPATSGLAGAGHLYNAYPVRFAHVDVTDSTAAAFTRRWHPRDQSRPVHRFAHYNMWRALSPPPQDTPLALCDARSVSPLDLIEADAVMDIPGKRESSYTALVLRYNPGHRWSYFPDMDRQEVLIFKTHDSDPREPSHVPHCAFSDPTCTAAAIPRASIETRAIAYWFEA